VAGPTSAVFGRGALTEGRLADIDALLAAKASRVSRTRKGRVWDVQIAGRPVHVSVENTEDVLWDCEDELLEAGLLPEDAPFRVVLSAGVNDAIDYDVLRDLANDLAVILGGPSSEPTK
jgi:hypothetical protein